MPKKTANMVVMVYNTHVVSDSTTPKTFKQVMSMPDGEEKTKWLEAIRNGFENFIKRK